MKRIAPVLAIAILAGCGAGLAQAPYSVAHSFGGRPVSPTGLIRASDGFYYGGANEGGTSGGYGAIYRSDDAGTVTVIHSFAGTDGAYPRSPLVQGSDAAFYGTTYAGGLAQYGTIYRMTAAGDLTTLHVFAASEGGSTEAGLVEGADGAFYGTTPYGGSDNGGTVFRIDVSGNFTRIYAFGYQPDGNYPEGGLVVGPDGALYGTTYFGGTGSCEAGCGAIVRITTSGSETVLHSFAGGDGARPAAGLIVGSDGSLYGTTQFGGSGGRGTIFKIDVAGHFTSLHSFSAGEGQNPAARLCRLADGSLYGTAGDTIFQLTPAGVLVPLHTLQGQEGGGPLSALVPSGDGFFYGTAWWGGSPGGNGFGSLYRLSDAFDFAVLHSFVEDDPAYPSAPVLQGTDGAYYGTTYQGGTVQAGTVFRFDGNTVATLHSFDPSQEGGSPSALIQAADGNFYGTTGFGGAGAGGGGTAFRIDSLGNLSVLHTFDCNVEGCASNPLLQGADGFFYGTTTVGTSNCGTLFRMDSLGNLATLHVFDGNDGCRPTGALIQAPDGDLYGTTTSTLFQFGGDGTLTTLHVFQVSDGATPNSLLYASDGSLYGTTWYGGDVYCTGTYGNGCGTIFRFSDSAVQTLHVFEGRADGANPNGPLIEGADGAFYGTTSAGQIPCDQTDGSCGTIFRVEASGKFTTVRELGGLSGAAPSASLAQGSDGFYGTTYGGGTGGLGVVFRLDTSLWVTAATPTSGPSSGGAAVTLSGFGFPSTQAVSFGGIPAPAFQVVDANHLQVTAPALAPGALHDVTVTNASAASSTLSDGYFADFLDVPQSDIFHGDVESIIRLGVTAGCGGGSYCRNSATRRKQMAVFVLKAKEGSSFVPPPAIGIFTDVPPADPFAPWIEELYNRGIVAGCGDGTTFCPNDPVLRQQMAVFLLKDRYGPGEAPPCDGIWFLDVPCSNPFAPWIEELAREGIAAGCGGGDFCPTNPATRGQMSAFLVRRFGLP